MNIYEKINKIMGEIKSLKKDGKIAFGNTKYNYLSEAKTTEIFREKLIENKLVLLPIHISEKKEGAVTHGEYTYRLVNAENPEEYIDLMAGGQGHDSADKGSGKASSYAYKYLLWRTFAVPSNDDPDQISSEEHTTEEEKKAFAALEAELIELYSQLGFDFKAAPKKYYDKYKVTISKSSVEQLQKAVYDAKEYIKNAKKQATA